MKKNQRKQKRETKERRGLLAALFSHAAGKSTGRNDTEDDELSIFDEDGNPLYDEEVDSLYDEDGNPLYDEYGNPLYDEDGNPLYDEDGNPLYDEYGNPLYDEDGNPLYDEYGNPLYDEDGYPLYDEEVDSLYDEDGNPLYDEYGNPLYDEDGNPLYDEYGNPLYDEDGNPLYDEDGYPLYDEDGYPLYDEEVDSLYDEYGNPLYDEDGNPLYDEYGNPLYDEDGNPLYDENGNPLYEENGNGSGTGVETGNSPENGIDTENVAVRILTYTPENIGESQDYSEPYDDSEYVEHENGEKDGSILEEDSAPSKLKGTRIYGRMPVGADEIESESFVEEEEAVETGSGEAFETTEEGDSALQPEEIRLFEPESDEDIPDGTRFKKGASSSVRVRMNDTEMSRAIEAAHRKTQQIREKKEAEKQKVRDKRKHTFEEIVRRSAANFVFGLAIFIGLLAAGYYFFLISDIRITGTTRQYSDDEIRRLTGISRREHILFVDLDEVRENISANPYMQVNKVEYVFPARIRIDLTERKEAAAIIGLDYNVIIDDNGYVLSMTSAGTENLVQITGVSMSGFKLGQRIGESSDFTTASLISIIAKLKEYGLTEKIRSVDMTTPLAIVMYTRNGFKIHVGQPTDLDNKFTTLSAALPRAEAARCFTGTLYLSAKGGAVYSPAGAETSALENASTDANAIRLNSGYEYGMYTAPDADGNVIQQQGYSTSNAAQQTQQDVKIQQISPDTEDEFQG